MKPTRDECGIVDLSNKILDKGALLNADVIISVSGVPLIGVHLKAVLAGMETMLNYGMMEAWDEKTREYYVEHYAPGKEIPLRAGEEVILQTFGSYWHEEGVYRSWRHGHLYLTNQRLFLFRREPPQIMIEIPLKEISRLTIENGMHMGGERKELILEFNEGRLARFHASNLLELKTAVEEQFGVLT